MQVKSFDGINARTLIRFVFRLPAGLTRRNPSSSFPLPIALIGAMKRIAVRRLLLMWLVFFNVASEAEQFRYVHQPEATWQEKYIPGGAGPEIRWCGASHLLVLGAVFGTGLEFHLLDASNGTVIRKAVGAHHERGYCSSDGKYLITVKVTEPFEVGLIEVNKGKFAVLYSDTLGRILPFDFGNPLSPDGRFLITVDRRDTPLAGAISLPILGPGALQNLDYHLTIWARDGSALYLLGRGFLDILDTATQRVVRKRLSIRGHNIINSAVFSPNGDKLYVLGYPDTGVGGSNLYVVGMSQPELTAKLLLEDIEGFDVGPNGEIYFVKSVGKLFQSESDVEYAKDAFDGVFVWRAGKQIGLIRKYSPGSVFDPVISQQGDMLAVTRVRDLRTDDEGVTVLRKH